MGLFKTTSKQHSPTQRVLPLLTALAVLANVFVYVFVGYSIYESRVSIEKTAQLETENLSTTLDYSLSEKFRRLDFVLQTAVREYDRQLNHGGIQATMLSAYLLASQENTPELDGLRITDRDGVITYNRNLSSNTVVSLADRDYFVYLRDHNDGQFFVGKAIQSRVTGNWVVPVARRLNDRQGQFAGMVYGTIRVELLTREFSAINVGEKGQIRLHDLAYRLITHFPVTTSSPQVMGKADLEPEGRAIIEQGLSAGSFSPSNSADEVYRVYSLRKLQKIPLIVSAGKAQQEYLQPWHQLALRYASFAVLFSLVSLFSVRMVRQSWLAQELATRQLEEAQQVLKKSEERFAGIFRFSPVGIAISSIEDGIILDANDAFAKLYGHSRDLLIGNSALKLGLWPNPEDRQRFVAAVRSHNTVLEWEFTQRNAKGEPINVLISGETLEFGNERYLLSVHQNITQRKRAEQALHEAMQAAKAANEAKSRFLAVMSHELRTPLNGVLGMAQMLMMPGIDEPERVDFAKTIYESGTNLLGLLNDILDHAKIEAGKLELHCEPYAPARVVEEVSVLFSESARSKQLGIVTQCNTGHDVFEGDANRIRQILTNLVNNAIKFTDQGEIEVSVRHTINAERVPCLRYAVRDTGIGIPEDKLQTLFKPFSQVDNSSTRRHDGTGLGLTICMSLVRMMGGVLKVDSTPNQGSTFWFELPCAMMDNPLHSPPPDAVAPVQGQQQENTAPASPSPTECRLLVVDDNPINRRVTLSLLHKLGCEQMDEAENGAEALALVQQGQHYDFILMDCLMPVMDGFETTRMIRQWEIEHGALPQRIIALTASAYEEDREKCLAAGMDGFVAKPVRLDDLKQALQSLN